jgi:predicted Zn-dependent peptidase
VADYILGGGGPSRLFAEIRSRQGLAYVVGSFFLEFKGPGLLGVGCQTKAASSVLATKAILDQLQKFSEGPISDDELALAKDALTNSYVFGFDTTAKIAIARAANEFYGYAADYPDIYTGRLNAVATADVLKAGRKYYAPAGMKVMIVGDERKFDPPLSTLGNVKTIPLKDIN